MTEIDEVGYHSLRSTIHYSSPDISEEERTATLPLPPFLARQRRTRSIQISRLPRDYTPADSPVSPVAEQIPDSRKIFLRGSDLGGRLTPRAHARKVFGLIFPSRSCNNLPISASGASSTRSLSPAPTPPTQPLQPVSAPPLYRAPSTASATESPSGSSEGTDENNSMTALRPPVLPMGNLTVPNRSIPNLASASSDSVNIASEPVPIANGREEDKPIASGNGVSCSIVLREPHVFLNGFDHDGRGVHSQPSCALLRGKLQLNVTKSAKIKAVTLKFMGKARTEWPEGLPPDKTRYFDQKDIRTTVMPFFNAMYDDAEHGYGAQCVFTPRKNISSDKSANSSSVNVSMIDLGSTRAESPAPSSNFLSPILGNRSRSSTLNATKDPKRLSLQTVQSRSFQKGDSPFGSTPQQKGYKTFHPGIYEYNFEIAIDHVNPETINVPLGSVKWELEAFVERAGTFRANLLGTRKVKIIRAPDQNSLEQVEPIAISRKWEDQLYYDIVISGKSFPLGSKIPIAFKLTPLAKVQCHRIKVFVTEHIEYFTHDMRVTRKDQTRKILLLEKHAGRSMGKQFAKSDIRVVSGGELDDERRAEARRAAENQRAREAKRTGTEPVPLPVPSDNLLGDIDLGLDSLITATEIEMNVQLPTCEEMKKDKWLKINPDTTYRQIQIHHWIKIVMRLSRLDAEDPAGQKRRHFEISIDSPFHILSCMADQNNTSLPEYTEFSGRHSSNDRHCGCPDATLVNSGSILNSGSNHNDGSTHSSSSGEVPTFDSIDQAQQQQQQQPPLPQQLSLDSTLAQLPRPAQAHLATNAAAGVQRPIHMLRSPSFNPPAFDAEAPPPPLVTPPPDYDVIIGTPSHDHLGDYFRRFQDAYSDDEQTDDEAERRATSRGRVNVASPRTPGGRLNRSMDIPRDFMFRPDALENRTRNAAPTTLSSS